MADTLSKLDIFTRSNNPELYAKAADFWPSHWRTEQCTGMNDWRDAATFLWYVIEEATARWVVVCDEDCFITDWKAVEAIAAKMEREGFTHAGMPEGGVCPHRCHSWVTMNPFFLVLDVQSIRKMALETSEPELINFHGFMPEMQLHRPSFIVGSYNHNNAEPFHGLFYWMARFGKPLYINAWTHPDGISTALRAPFPGEEVFALHSWYSREYGSDQHHTKRINSLYEEARNHRSLPQ